MGGAWVRVAELAELESERALRIVVDGVAVLVFRTGAGVAAIGEACPHAGGRIAPELATGGFAVCPAHGYAFELRTGRCRALRSVLAETFAARAVDGVVFVRRGLLERARAWWRARPGGSGSARG